VVNDRVPVLDQNGAVLPDAPIGLHVLFGEALCGLEHAARQVLISRLDRGSGDL